MPISREINQGPHYDSLQKLFESCWVPDMMSTDHLLLKVDLVIVPDPSLAKYLVESYYEKEVKVEKKRNYYANLLKQPWGSLDSFPPRERYEYERIKNLDKQKWIRKFPPLATCGSDAYQRLKNHGQVETHPTGIFVKADMTAFISISNFSLFSSISITLPLFSHLSLSLSNPSLLCLCL